MQLVGVLDHLEQRAIPRGTVDFPGGVENFVAAVLGVGLCEHHQLDVVGIAAEGLEVFDQVVDLVIGEGEAEGAVCLDQRGSALRENGHAGHGARSGVMKKSIAGGDVAENDLRHAVVEAGCEQLPHFRFQI